MQVSGERGDIAWMCAQPPGVPSTGDTNPTASWVVKAAQLKEEGLGQGVQTKLSPASRAAAVFRKAGQVLSRKRVCPWGSL